MQTIRWIIIILMIIGLILIASNYYKAMQMSNVKDFFAGIFFVDSTTEQELKTDYNLAKRGPNKIKFLIVPGHDDKYWGTEFRGLKESDLNIKLAKEIETLFKKEKTFEIISTRNENGYSPIFLSYFENQEKKIKEFYTEYKNVMNTFLRSGAIKNKEWIEHNNAPSGVATKLYGINKWANENDVDLVLHIHFNDYPRRSRYWRGKYSGFSIYVPESQYSNSKASIAIAGAVFNQMGKFFPASDLPKEKAGIIEDQKLIAIGSYNTLDPAVLLLEYGYIYESQFTSPETRPLVLKELALQTYAGIKNFFENKKIEERKIATLPHKWNSNLKNGIKYNKDVFALQTALMIETLYPPKGFTKNNCPINGNFGPCTETSVKEFQKLYEIEPVMGFVGPLTRGKLNELYSK